MKVCCLFRETRAHVHRARVGVRLRRVTAAAHLPEAVPAHVGGSRRDVVRRRLALAPSLGFDFPGANLDIITHRTHQLVRKEPRETPKVNFGCLSLPSLHTRSRRSRTSSLLARFRCTCLCSGRALCTTQPCRWCCSFFPSSS